MGRLIRMGRGDSYTIKALLGVYGDVHIIPAMFGIRTSSVLGPNGEPLLTFRKTKWLSDHEGKTFMEAYEDIVKEPPAKGRNNSLFQLKKLMMGLARIAEV